jgi:predicted transcriptional regulator
MNISLRDSRTRTEIMAHILDAFNDGNDNGYDGIRNTHLIYPANLSSGKLEEHLKISTDNEYRIKHINLHSTNHASLFPHNFMVRIISIMIVLQTTTVLIFVSVIPNDSAATAAIPDFNIAAAGDWGCTASTKSTINNIVSKNTEVTIGLGDNSYATTADCWLSEMAPIDNQMHTAIGNHDVRSSQLLAQYMDHYKTDFNGKQYFSFNYQNVHFLVLSTEAPYGIDSAQYNFLQHDLQTAACNPNINWILVAYHRPAYVSQNPNHRAVTDLRSTYHPIFEKYGVDFVLQAHVHAYERSYPLKFNSANPGSPTIESTSTTDYNDPVGQIFATVGTGGESSYHFSSKDPAFVTQSTNMFGFLNIDITNNGLTLKATFFGNDGSTKDQFTIQKSGDIATTENNIACLTSSGTAQGGNATTTIGGGSNQSTSEVRMNLEQARTALQNNDRQSGMMYLDMALSSMGGVTEENITASTAGIGNAATGGEEGVAVGGTSAADDYDDTSDDNG